MFVCFLRRKVNQNSPLKFNLTATVELNARRLKIKVLTTYLKVLRRAEINNAVAVPRQTTRHERFRLHLFTAFAKSKYWYCCLFGNKKFRRMCRGRRRSEWVCGFCLYAEERNPRIASTISRNKSYYYNIGKVMNVL